MVSSIKLWDLRKTSCQVHGTTEPLPLRRKNQIKSCLPSKIGYVDMITNVQPTLSYASGTNEVIYCYSLNSDLLSE